MRLQRPPSLARYLALAYALLIVYASLHPFIDWRDSGVPVLEFLFARWPRYYTVFDLAVNVVVYIPFGFLLVPALRDPLGGRIAAAFALIAASMLSFSMELVQNFLPSRVPSNLDLACNCFGALCGVLMGLRWGNTFRDGGTLNNLREVYFVSGKRGDVGLLLLALWLLAQLSPEALLFGNGDLRRLFDLPAPFLYTKEGNQAIELGVTAASMLAVGLLAWRMLIKPTAWLIVVLFASALLIKAIGAGVLLGPDQYAHWVTPGNLTGLAIGVVLLFVGLVLPVLLQEMLASLAVLLATVLVNLAPENPYLLDALQYWNPGHFLNFNGLTLLASSLWPYFALAFLVSARKARGSIEKPLNSDDPKV